MKTSHLVLTIVTLAVPAFAGPPPFLRPELGAAAAGAAAASNWRQGSDFLRMPDPIVLPRDLAPQPTPVPMPAPAIVEPRCATPMVNVPGLQQAVRNVRVR